MMLTEEEAKTKWCPFARIIASETDSLTAAHHTGYNRVFINADGFKEDGRTNRNPNMARCIGSACMAWRFQSQEEYEAACEAWEDAANIGGITDRGPQPAPLGYCGLAGKQ